MVKKLGDILATFDELNLRVSVLKTNPHMKNFYDKLTEIEKIVRVVTDIINEWIMFQKNWLFLNGIFSRATIGESLSIELKLFTNITVFFRNTIKSLLV